MQIKIFPVISDGERTRLAVKDELARTSGRLLSKEKFVTRPALMVSSFTLSWCVFEVFVNRKGKIFVYLCDIRWFVDLQASFVSNEVFNFSEYACQQNVVEFAKMLHFISLEDIVRVLQTNDKAYSQLTRRAKTNGDA